MKHTKKEVVEVLRDARSKSDLCKALGFCLNGAGMRRVNKYIKEYDLDISHFDGGRSKKVKWKIITKECPVCGKEFETQEGHSREKTTCSHSCSNTYFRSGEDNPNWDGGTDRPHRKICFQYYEKQCLICGYDRVVEVHHIDENHDNNDPENLVPLCPNHHREAHCNVYKNEIQEQINKLKLVEDIIL